MRIIKAAIVLSGLDEIDDLLQHSVCMVNNRISVVIYFLTYRIRIMLHITFLTKKKKNMSEHIYIILGFFENYKENLQFHIPLKRGNM